MECPVISTNLGKVKGILSKNLDGEIFYSYLGVPYGKPPVGKLRFKAPEPAEPWEGVKDTRKPGNVSIQSNFRLNNKMIGSEDCLWLNVHTKLTNTADNLKPVIVYFFGGKFVRGDATEWGPEYLMLEDVVIVTVNFRLGVLGFLAIEDRSLDVPGNAALKDCVLALKWIRDNIEQFGGDSKNVTIWGHSSGGTTAHLLVLSPSCKDLFHRAIVLGQTSVVINEHVTEKVFEVPQLLLKDSSTVSPIIEAPNETQFLTQSPLKLMQNGDYNHVPMLFGYTSKEGLSYLVLKGSLRHFENITNISKHQCDNIDIREVLAQHIILEDGGKIEKMLKEFYFVEDKWPKIEDGLWFLYGDSYFVSTIYSAVRHHRNTTEENVYVLRSDFEGKNDFMKSKYHLHSYKGVMHGDDLGYMFKHYVTTPDPNCSEIERGSREEKALRRYVKLITNFAKHGNPTPADNGLKIDWNPAKDENNFEVLNFNDEMEMIRFPEVERMDVWKQVFNMNPITRGFI